MRFQSIRLAYVNETRAKLRRFKDSESPFVSLRELSHCSLRTQLLLALADHGKTDVCARDPCLPLALTLDQCLRERCADFLPFIFICFFLIQKEMKSIILPMLHD